MTPDMDTIAYDDVVRVGKALDALLTAIGASKASAKACGREELAKGMYAMENVMCGFWHDVARIIGEWDA